MKLIAQLFPLPAGLAGVFSILATVGDMDPSILSIVGNGVTVVVLAWYVIYDVRVRSPQMLAAFATEQAAIRKSFTDEQEDIRKTFRDEQSGLRESYRMVIEGMRSTFSTEQSLMRQTFSTEQTAARSHCEKETAELRNMLIENLKGMRTAVHDVRDVAQEFISKSDERRPLVVGGQNKS